MHATHTPARAAKRAARLNDIRAAATAVRAVASHTHTHTHRQTHSRPKCSISRSDGLKILATAATATTATATTATATAVYATAYAPTLCTYFQRNSIKGKPRRKFSEMKSQRMAWNFKRSAA